MKYASLHAHNATIEIGREKHTTYNTSSYIFINNYIITKCTCNVMSLRLYSICMWYQNNTYKHSKKLLIYIYIYQIHLKSEPLICMQVRTTQNEIDCLPARSGAEDYYPWLNSARPVAIRRILLFTLQLRMDFLIICSES